MNRKQTITIALMCAVAALLVALMLWRQPGAPSNAGSSEHAGHADSHGHDDRHEERHEDRQDHAPGAAPAHADEDERAIVMSAAQIKTAGIAIDNAQPALIQERLHLPAQVKANAERSVALAAPAAGIVQSVLVSNGAFVKKGQALVTVNSPAVAGWRADAAAARARLALAQTVQAREQTLWEQGISARQDLDAAQAALQEARIAAAAARSRLDALGIGTGRDASSDNVSSTVTLRAPYDGVVVERPVVAGQSVDETRLLLTVADLSQVWVEAAVPGVNLAQVSVGMPARVSIAAQPRELEGTVSFVGPVLGEATRMATARVILPNRDGRLRPGMLADVDLMGQPGEVAVTVAADAVQTVHERSVVFVRTGTGFRAQDVSTGRSDGKRTEIVKGLDAGTPYASAGSFVLKADLGKGEAEHDH